MSYIERLRGFAGAIGTLFGGSRDLYNVFGYTRTLQYTDKLHKFQRQDIAARIVEAEPHATWADPPQIIGDDAFNKAWADLKSDFALFNVFNRADKLAGMSKFVVIIIGVDDGKELKEPVDTSRENKITYLQPYSEGSTEIMRFVEDQTDPRYGKPEMYRISPSVDEKKNADRVRVLFNAVPFEVHHSRVVHIAENILEDTVIGTPRLDRVYNLLDDLLKTVGGSSETYWLSGNRGLQVDVDKEMDLQTGDAKALQEEVDDYVHNLSRIIKTRGVKINPLGSDVADPRGNFQVLISLISGATGIPQRILLGSEAGQLASEQDRANWAVRIAERRSMFAEPVILIPFIKLCISINALPKPTTLTVKWPDAFKMSPLERAQASAQKARTLANVAKSLSDPESSPITREEGREIIGLTDTTPIFDSPDDADGINGEE